MCAPSHDMKDAEKNIWWQFRGIALDSITVSNKPSTACSVTLPRGLFFVSPPPTPCAICKELVCTDDFPIVHFSQGIKRPRPAECTCVTHLLIRDLKKSWRKKKCSWAFHPSSSGKVAWGFKTTDDVARRTLRSKKALNLTTWCFAWT